MAARDYESAPASEELGLVRVINGLVADLESLRAGNISTQDAIARSLLAKQIFNGVRIYLTGAKMLTERAKTISEPPSLPQPKEP